MILRLITFCLVAILPSVYCEGTLKTNLERYKNHTCGGYVQGTYHACDYSVSLSIQSHIFRGRKLIKKTNHYTITDDPAQNRSGRFTFSSKRSEIVFPKHLGSLPNPIPIKIIEGSVSITLFVENLVERLFDKTYTFNTDVLEADRSNRHEDIMRSGFFILTTELQCNPRFMGTGCLQCGIGWFGYRCSVQCSPGSGYTCHPVTGERVCTEYYHGADCEQYCQPTLNYTCTQSGSRLCRYPARGLNCDKTTACPEHRYGTNCEVTCLPVPGQVTCDEMGGKVCDGPFTGPNCTSCKPHHYGSHCNTTCAAPRAAPRYTCNAAGERVCRTGWGGARCEECNDMWYGEGCEVFCDTTSSRYTCTEEGYKTCRENWGGSACGVCRRRDYYGPSCQVYCPASGEGWWHCNSTTGEKMCVSNRTGEDCSRCIEEYYPVEGSADCRRCVETYQYTCTSEGAKSCKPTWFGRDCNVTCVATETYTCNMSDGSKDCKFGYFSGSDCETCKEDFFGPACTCKETIVSTCDSNGNVHCKKDYYDPPSCKTHCNSSSTNYRCSPTGSKECIGNRDWTKECETCITHWYGEHCNTKCITEHRNEKCNSTGGTVCIEGWTGLNCTECAPNWYGNTCQNDDSVCVKTCYAFCVDITNYTCNGEGVLEPTTKEEDTYELELLGVVIGCTLYGVLLAVSMFCVVRHC